MEYDFSLQLKGTDTVKWGEAIIYIILMNSANLQIPFKGYII